ncbi:MAG: hypothetical protein V4717_19620 [Bacteroidota bacterium]
MKIIKKQYTFLWILFAVLVVSGCGGPVSPSGDSSDTSSKKIAGTIPANAVSNALPYNLEFEEQNYSGNTPLPRLQSYVAATASSGELLIIGGRRQGLHTFQAAPAKNFIPDSSNNYLFVIDPKTGNSWSFDVNKLPANLAAPLQSTNQQSYHDLASDQLYLVGGYGWNADQSDMLTFNTMISFKVDVLVALIKGAQPAQKIADAMQFAQDDRLAVTGGELFKMGGKFYLVFGQKFTGQYRAFGGTDFKQQYTEEFRVFTLMPNTLKILSYGASTNKDAGQPFHRRDGNIIEDIDPATGRTRIAAFGGVFKPGIIGAYTTPVYITGPGMSVVDSSVEQKFSQYECPVIPVYDSTNTPTMYHSFFGGIGHYYYNQTPSQKAAYDTVSAEGRNDGFPFVEDITTFLQTADGNYKEYIHTNQTPGNRLVGSSVRFIINRGLYNNNLAYPNGVIQLANFSNNSKQLVGYIYGGVEAQNPLPLRPNTGTFVSNSLFAVYLTRTPTAAIPASEGHESVVQDANLQRR